MKTLDQVPEELLPAPKDVDFYEQHGWYISPRVLSDEQIEEALLGVERHHRGERDHSLEMKIKQYLDWQPGSERQLRMNDYVALTNDQLHNLIFSPVIGAIAARLARAPQIRLFNSSMVYKPPQVASDAVKVGWHTDRAYWKTCTSDRMLTAWIPLHDCDETMGTVTMIDGSHRWPDNELTAQVRQEKTFITNDMAGLERRLEALGLPLRRVPMNLRRGQISFHHCLTLHGSDVNRSQRPRIAVIVHMQDQDNRYRPWRDERGELYVYNNDQLCRRTSTGEPDYSDPEICPPLWPAGRN